MSGWGALCTIALSDDGRLKLQHPSLPTTGTATLPMRLVCASGRILGQFLGFFTRVMPPTPLVIRAFLFRQLCARACVISRARSITMSVGRMSSRSLLQRKTPPDVCFCFASNGDQSTSRSKALCQSPRIVAPTGGSSPVQMLAGTKKERGERWQLSTRTSLESSGRMLIVSSTSVPTGTRSHSTRETSLLNNVDFRTRISVV